MDADSSLMELLQSIQDPRGARGKRHPLPALLALAVVAMLSGMTTYEAIVDYGQQRGWEFLRLLGFTRRRGLCKATYSRVFRRIDVAAFEARLAQWIQGRLGSTEAPHLALDGKTVRGSRDGQAPGIHLVSAYAPDVRAVVGQLRVDAKTNEHKAALELLGVLPLRGKVVSGDAMVTHRDVCAEVVRGGGDYVLPVKENQPTLRADLAAAFAEPEAGLSPPPDRAPRRDVRPRVRGGQGAWANREADRGGDHLAGRVPGAGLAGLPAGLPLGTGAADRRAGRDRGGVRDHQPAAGARRGPGVAPTDPKPLGDRERPARGPGWDAP
jgi:hypothetical protein